MIVHADDFGITLAQAQSLLTLSKASDKSNPLSSVSIFANSPVFYYSAKLLHSSVENKTMKVSLHLNLVEGAPCTAPGKIPLLIGERKTFCHSFIGLLQMSLGPRRSALYQQIVQEFDAQIKTFLRVFPEQQHSLRVDSHQHTHMIPLVFDALQETIQINNCTLEHVRIPVEDLTLYAQFGLKHMIPWQNRLKNSVLSYLSRHAKKQLSNRNITSSFCGIAFSGSMYQMTPELLFALEEQAHQNHQELEVLYHPITVPLASCLDPENLPFATACASDGRDKEAQSLLDIKETLYCATRSSAHR